MPRLIAAVMAAACLPERDLTEGARPQTTGSNLFPARVADGQLGDYRLALLLNDAVRALPPVGQVVVDLEPTVACLARRAKQPRGSFVSCARRPQGARGGRLR